MALFDFEELSDPEATTFDGAGHTAFARGDVVTDIIGVAGPVGCGTALQFEDTNAGFIEIPDHPDFHITRGSIDFWLRYDADACMIGTGGDFAMGLLSRDAKGTPEPGHLTIVFRETCQVRGRHQAETARALVATPGPVGIGEWKHLAVEFGPEALRLYVDGVLQSELSGVGVGLEGNSEPWALGANADNTEVGTVDGARGAASGVGIDRLRILRAPE